MTLIKGSIKVEANSHEDLHVEVGYNHNGTGFIRFLNTAHNSNVGYNEQTIHEVDFEPLTQLLDVMTSNSVSFEDLIEYCENLTDYRG